MRSAWQTWGRRVYRLGAAAVRRLCRAGRLPSAPDWLGQSVVLLLVGGVLRLLRPRALGARLAKT